MGLVEITADVYSASDILRTELSYACVGTLTPGSDSPFDILVFDPPDNVDHVELRVTDYSKAPFIYDPPIGLDGAVTNDYADLIGYRHLVGQVTNNSSNYYAFIKVCAAFYDEAGSVVRTASVYASPDGLSPGQAASFDASVDEEGAGIVSHRIWVDGKNPYP